MCQAIRDGGRRCPQHRHGSVGIIRGVASLHSELNSTQVDRLFSELRREGRDSNIPNAVFAVIRDNFIISNPELDEATQIDIRRHLALSTEHDEDIDSATIYALSTLNSRATERQTALTNFYREIAQESGLTVPEVKQKFEEEYASVDTSRGSETPVEYDQNTRRRAVLANLPYDRASVVAIERLRSLTISDAPPEAASEMIRRIERVEPSVPSRAIQEFGWHNGRLEIVFRSNPDTVYAYRNVSEEQWNTLRDSSSPGREWRYIRNNPAYAYDSQEEADQDALAARCINCGQFRSADGHSCPQIENRETMLASGMTTDEVNSELEELFPEEQTLADRQEREVEEIIDLENQAGLEALRAILQEDEEPQWEEEEGEIYPNSSDDEELMRIRTALTGEPPAVMTRRIDSLSLANNSETIESFGWHDGRLEVIFWGSDDIHAYRNVSFGQWDALRTSNSPEWTEWGMMFNNAGHEYTSQEEADADAEALRCEACGQFRSLEEHICPESTVEEEASPVSTSQSDEAALASLRAALLGLEPVESPAEETEEEVSTPARNSRTRPRRTPRITPEALALPDMPDLREDPSERIVEVQESFTYDHEKFITLASVAARSTSTGSSDPIHDALIGVADNSTTLDLSVEGDENSIVKIDRIYELGNYDFTGVEELREEASEFLRAISIHNDREGSDYDRTGGVVMLEVNPRPPSSNYGANRKVVRIVGMYSSSSFNLAKSVQAQRQQRYESRYTTYKLAPITHSYTIPERTYEELEAEKAAFDANVSSLIESGDVVRVVSGSTMRISSLNKTRGFITHSEGYIKSNLPGKIPLAAAYKDGKAVVTKIEHLEYANVSQIRNGTTYNIDGATYVSITGEVITRMTPEGEVQIIGQNLRCMCRKYRENYYCGHIGLAIQDIPKLYQAHSKPQPASTPGVGDAGREAVVAARSVTYSIGIEPETSRSFVKVSMPRRGTPFGRSISEANSNEVMLETRIVEEDTERMSNLLGRRIEDLSDEESEFIARYHSEAQQEDVRISRRGTTSVTPLENQSYLSAIVDSDVEIPIHVSHPREGWSSINVTGTVKFGTGSTPEEPIILSRDLRCSCSDYSANYRCPHIDITERRYLSSYLRTKEDLQLNGISIQPEETDETPTVRPHIPAATIGGLFGETIIRENTITQMMRYRGFATRAEAVADIAETERREALERERERQRIAAATAAYEEYRVSRIAAWDTVGSSLSENVEAFRTEVEDIRRRKRRGETIIEMKTENVTDGICAPGEGTRSFGVELEFDIKSGVNKNEALRKIGAELHEAGLTTSARQQHYHSANGSWESWSFEQDCTVAGEIVSPIMKDTPEDWEQLRKVIEIVKRNGGRASTKAGSHVNISSASLGGSTAKHAELTRIMKQNQDTMFRVASDPGRGSHRGNRWCSPNLDIANQDIDSSQIGRARSGTNGTHGSMINFDASMNQRQIDKARIEYRLWDATLDVGVIQQQVAFSAAMTDLAEREVIKNEGYKASRDVAEVETDPDMRAAKLFDRLFRTDTQRKAATQLFAITNPV